MTNEGMTFRAFIREIPIGKLTDNIYNDYETRGYIIIWKDESIEIWVE